MNRGSIRDFLPIEGSSFTDAVEWMWKLCKRQAKQFLWSGDTGPTAK